tara:strand:- start:61 stop:360 length:300 start_codon:yes stop_codon:yes gene_type:complete
MINSVPQLIIGNDYKKKNGNRNGNGHKLILCTNRGDSEEYPVFTEAVNWCRERGLEFDSVNENLPIQKKLSGYSPKIMADIYLDDKALNIFDWCSLIDE